MARVTTTDISAAIVLCENKVEDLTNTQASKYPSGKSNTDSVIPLLKLVVVLQQPLTLTDNELEIIYMDALDRSGANDIGVDSSTLTLNTI